MSEQNTLPAEPKPQISAGGALAALVPQTLDEAFRISKALAVSGDMVPKHFQGKPEMIMAAVMRGAEIGLMPMQALSNIAVINGRASIWGDALPALLQRAGHHIDVEIVGEGDSAKAVATLTRGDTGRTITREFSVADAKKAGLWGKQGPWQQYPTRMLQMRARAWAVRDGAADALMGLQVAEEASDMQPIRDVTPKEPGGFAQKAAAARKPEPPAIVEGEVMPAEDMNTSSHGVAHWTDGIDDVDGDPSLFEFDEGVTAFNQGKAKSACPYESGTTEATTWLAGWLGALKATFA